MKNTKADLLMVSATAAWGFSYIFMKMGLESVGPFQLIFLRFGLAFTLLFLVFGGKIKPRKREIYYSLILGLLVFTLSTFYMYGLKTTPASTAGFLAGTTVVMVPLLNAVIRRQLPTKKVALATILALAGVAAMSLTQGLYIAGGAWLCLAGAACYAVHILVTNRALANCQGLTIGVWQMFFVALTGALAAGVSGEFTLALDAGAWFAVLGLAIICSAYGYIAQTMAQKSITPERIGFIYSLEPIFCAVLTFLFFQETMTLQQVFGAILIIISIII